ncbi:hypothetical protein HYPSUDRAFT_43768 [Hypholoma sublateritium FD-334 SS-4]|uniref:Ribonuclease H1 N-terminal domain-containing protein n=1 Tax=Hypholoma sublateritium (strain FD-334 SS-4) TaxID=945553 RepID=A0A0D2PIP5_HYPSF|nr:hypothetical protein HYPSUDRAFT_43768 [Hypholoma sublateritium FD-334 SS-4]
MAKRKWYVVTVGTDIGVFSTWLDAGPLVKGVPEALYQSFSTEEEAQMIFAREQARGRTRIVGGAGERGHPSPRESRHNSPAYFSPSNASAAQQVKNESFESSIYMNPELWPNNSHGVTAHASPSLKSSRGAVHAQLPKTLSISRSTSEPSPSMRRFQIIDSFFTKPATGVGVKAGVSSAQSTPALTPTSDVMRLPHSPTSSHSSSRSTPRAVVETPSWVASYPTAPAQPSQMLSPLTDPGLSVRSFQEPQRVTASFDTYSGKANSEHRTPTTQEYSIYSSPTKFFAIADDTHKRGVDPRSPIMSQAQVPELMFSSSLLLSRPSPSGKAARPFDA